MRGAARIAVSKPDVGLGTDVGRTMACVVCGAPTTFYGATVRSSGERQAVHGPGGIWDDNFTDRDKILLPPGQLGRAICAHCVTAARDWKLNASSPTRREPKGRPYLFADQRVTVLGRGIQGLYDIAALANRTEPFALLAGTWQQLAYHWAWTPVAYPSRVFPALWVAFGSSTVVLLDATAIAAVADEAKGAGATDSEKGINLPEGSSSSQFVRSLRSLDRVPKEGGRELVLFTMHFPIGKAHMASFLHSS